VVQKKTTENDGYDAIQVGFGAVKADKLPKPLKGHFEKANTGALRVLREFRLADTAQYNVGDAIQPDIFAEGDFVDVQGTSKGKGYAGPIKRYGQHRLKETHGTGPVHRQAGSMGACSSPSRIYKGKGLAGHMGAETVTVQNLKIVSVDAENHLIAVRGAIPGPKGSLVTITNSVKKG
jgi:large subunit ribosomal protein L3